MSNLSPTRPEEQRERFIDQLAIENSGLDAEMKTICHGC
jgi:hypothetical protein